MKTFEKFENNKDLQSRIDKLRSDRRKIESDIDDFILNLMVSYDINRLYLSQYLNISISVLFGDTEYPEYQMLTHIRRDGDFLSYYSQDGRLELTYDDLVYLYETVEGLSMNEIVYGAIEYDDLDSFKKLYKNEELDYFKEFDGGKTLMEIEFHKNIKKFISGYEFQKYIMENIISKNVFDNYKYFDKVKWCDQIMEEYGDIVMGKDLGTL